MTAPIKILLQTTISDTPDDWHIGRFELLRRHLASCVSDDGTPLFAVTARNREPVGTPDPVLSSIDRSDYDQLWLFAVDMGDGLHELDCEAISRFRRQGRGLMVTRDHMDLGSSVCTLGGIGLAHHFHSKQPELDPSRHRIDDVETSYISWPNYHSGANGDVQIITPVEPVHPLLVDAGSPAGILRYLPAHPHEGAVGAPPQDPSARVIATGVSKVSGNRFNLAVAFDAGEGGGPALAQSTFHHFADYNWNPARGCPSFVSEAPGNSLAQTPGALEAIHRYVENIALWLSGRLEPCGEVPVAASTLAP